ncbi:endonuclease/exonuclease/phosphatase family protein [Thiohalomonas denitrificans]|uniref:endonuclease/exonuclease/phosphatase family protein n=1 Tax=Thiohalomonas denitrificans TaxID=415747 RepID=UPI0026EB4830|nr:endonuclease/exonuclease/phosphatase family protein [Thiohalomonas denitrificans]
MEAPVHVIRRLARTYLRWLFLILLPVAGVLGLPLLHHVQMPSAFGQAVTAGECAELRPDWQTGGAVPVSAFLNDLPPLRAVTFNLHSGLGPEWRLWVDRATAEQNLRHIARRIASAAPANAPVDVVSLNEVDFDSRRSGWLDQAAFLAGELEKLTGYAYQVRRGETWSRDIPGLEVRFGNALLSRHPVLETQDCLLGSECPGVPSASPRRAGWLMDTLEEPRGVLKARIAIAGRELDLLVTHLEAFRPERRESQAAEILARFVDGDVPTLLMGDINAVPSRMTAKRRHFAADRTHDVLSSGPLVDARFWVAARDTVELKTWATYPARAPQWPLDAVFATPDLLPSNVTVLGSEASDHHGLAVHYDWATAPTKIGYSAWRDNLRRDRWARILACDRAGEEPERLRRLERLTFMSGGRAS